MQKIVLALACIGLLLAACRPAALEPAGSGQLKVLAVESFLADIAQNVAGERLKVETLMPLGLDPHAFEATPQDVARIASSNVLIVNGAGLEEWLQELLNNAGGERTVIEAAAGLQSRLPAAGEAIAAHEGEEAHHHEGDPHFWLNPLHVVTYVENIRDGLIRVDPQGRDLYMQNAAAYIVQLKALDQSIQQQVAVIPPERRLIVTNHESFGYFADRYGFKIIGTIIPSVSSGAAPSAQQLAGLVDHIRQSGASAIFLETGASPQLAEQISKETGVKVITDLYTHSLTVPDGNAPTYIDMMKHNLQVILQALK